MTSTAMPLVTIGIPTFNRLGTLRRTIASVLAQEYSNFQVVISDNASTDGTEAACIEYAQQDKRIRYVRQTKNLGPTANFNAVLAGATGEYFMWLADDDWLDHNYLAVCINHLIGNPELVLVGGVARIHGENQVLEGLRMSLHQSSPAERLLKYVWRVRDNSVFYGVMRRQVIGELRLRNLMANDWLFVGAMAFRGKVETVSGACLHRMRGGTSASPMRIARTLGLSPLHGLFMYLSAANNFLADIGWREIAYKKYARAPRFLLAIRVFALIVFRKSIYEPPKRGIIRTCRFILGDERYGRLKVKLAMTRTARH